MGKKVVIALGGNAILRPNEDATFENQLNNVKACTDTMAEIAAMGYSLVITHGNGPQVGAILQQNEEARHVVPKLPLMACGAQSQGLIGYMMEQCLRNSLNARGVSADVVALLTQTEVDFGDKAFANPIKPIGMFYNAEEAKQLEADLGWIMAEDAGRGYRRVVPSPMPRDIHGVGVIKKLADQGVIVISTGGGGVPVVKKEDGSYEGIDAVIDKDRSALRLSEQIDADIFMMLTDVSNVYINYGKPGQQRLDTLNADAAWAYYQQGHFSEGSMGPKVEAAINFARQGKEAVICSLNDAVYALEGTRGTRITPARNVAISGRK